MNKGASEVISFACPRCGAGTNVIDSRPTADKNCIRRRRRCIKCRHSFGTSETEGREPDAVLQGVFENLAVAKSAFDTAMSLLKPADHRGP